MRAVVTGMIATYPVGGVAWDYGQYALGLEQLGFEVWYLEDSGLDSFDAERGEYGPSFRYGARFLQEALATLSPTLAERWHVRGSGGESYGVDAAAIPALVADSDLFLNVSGGCLLREEYLPSPRKVLVDTDPGWNHFVIYPRTEIAPAAGAAKSWRGHDAFFTYAACIGEPGCRLPDLGVNWHTTRPPVVTDQWSARPPGETWTMLVGVLTLAVAGCGQDASAPAPDEPVEAAAEATTASDTLASGPSEPEQSRDCPALDIRTSEGGITAELPCGANVEPLGGIIDRFVKHDGEHCLELDYKLGGREETRIFCPGADPEGELTELWGE